MGDLRPLAAIRQAIPLLVAAQAALTPTVALDRDPDVSRPWWRGRWRWTVTAACGCRWTGWSRTFAAADRDGWRAYGHALTRQHRTQEDQ